MAIQIPRVQVDQSVEQEHAPRLAAPNVDVATPMMRQSNALESVAKDAVQLHNELQHQQADTTGTNAQNEYLIWRKKRLYGDPDSGWVGYANIKGRDPQDLYKEFEKEEQDKLDGLASPKDNEKWIPEVQNVVNRRLSNSYKESKLETLTTYSHQKQKYDDSITTASVGLAQFGMYGASSFITPGDDQSFAQIESKIARIRNVHIAKGLRYQTAQESEDGQYLYNDGVNKKAVNLTPMLQHDIAEDVAKGITDATTNLIHSKDIDRATALKEWAERNGYLDNAALNKLGDHLEKAKLKKEAYALADQARRSGDETILDKIQDPEKRLLSKQILNNEQRTDAAMEGRKSKENYNILSPYVDKVMSSQNPYQSRLDADNDPNFVKMMANVTDEKQKKAIYHSIEQPTDSNPQAHDKIVDLFLGKDPNRSVRGMSSAEFRLQLTGLNKSDTRKYQNMYEKMNLPTNAQMESDYRLFGKEFEKQAVGAGLLRQYPNSKNLVSSDQILSNVLQKDLLDSIEGLPPMNPQERSKYVAKFIADEKAGVKFTRPEGMFNGGTRTPPKTQPSPTDSDQSARDNVEKYWGNQTPAARMDWALKYMKEKGVKQVPDETMLKSWVATKVKF